MVVTNLQCYKIVNVIGQYFIRTSLNVTSLTSNDRVLIFIVIVYYLKILNNLNDLKIVNPCEIKSLVFSSLNFDQEDEKENGWKLIQVRQ